MKRIFAFILVVIMAFGFIGCNKIKYTVPETFKDGDQLNMPSDGELIAIFDTNLGEIRVRLFPAQAPKAVDNFMTLVQRKYYDGNIFHRVLNNYIAQSGDPTGTGGGGTSKWGKPFKDEFDTKLFHYKGALAYANQGLNTNASQFFFVTESTKVYEVDKNELLKKGYSQDAVNGYVKGTGDWELDALWNNHEEGYTVFGQIYSGFDVLDKINAVEVSDEKPVTNIVINKVTVTTYK